MPTVDAVLASLRRRFAAAGLDTATLDARVLMGHVLNRSPAGLISAGADPVSPEDEVAIEAVALRRLSGEPVGRILGRREFHGLDFVLGPATLEPRPDTETLVDLAVSHVRRGGLDGIASDGDGLVFADIGTGSGAIAVATAVALPAALGIATDISPEALAVAEENARRHGVADRLSFRCGSYLEPLDAPVQLLLSNPPYIASDVIETLDPAVRLFDPRKALDGGPDGLDAYRVLAAGTAAVLSPGGTFAVEIGFDQRNAVETLFRAGGLADVRCHPDLQGRDRVVSGRRAPG